MKAFEGHVSGVDLEATSQDDNMFDKIGDDVKIVTHCGKSIWKNLGGDTLERQQDKILGEYLIYKILEEFKTTTMKARLAKVTYRYSNGLPMATKYAFFRENRSSIAKRCKLKKNKPENLKLDPNHAFPKFHAQFLHKFVISNDYALYREHNVKYVYKVNENSYSPIYIPYDFDLSGILEPFFIRNLGLPMVITANTFRGFVQNFANVSGKHRQVAIVQVQKVLKQKQDIKELIEGTEGLSAPLRARFLKWHKLYFKALSQLDIYL